MGMKLRSAEYYELITQFEKIYKGYRIDKEPKELWHKRIVYQDGELNKLFTAYFNGFAYGVTAIKDKTP